MNAKTLIVFLAMIAGAFAFGYSRIPQAICHEKFVTGPCRKLLERYGFDDKQGKCVKFIYGGCQGNDNNFPTLEACEKACEYLRANIQ